MELLLILVGYFCFIGIIIKLSCLISRRLGIETRVSCEWLLIDLSVRMLCCESSLFIAKADNISSNTDGYVLRFAWRIRFELVLRIYVNCLMLWKVE